MMESAGSTPRDVLIGVSPDEQSSTHGGLAGGTAAGNGMAAPGLVAPMQVDHGANTLLPSPTGSPGGGWTKRHYMVLGGMGLLLLVGVVTVIWTSVDGSSARKSTSSQRVLPTLDGFVLNSTLSPDTVLSHWGPHGSTRYMLRDGAVLAVDANASTPQVFVPASDMVFQGTQLPVFDFSVSPDASHVLLFTNKQAGWRHSYLATYYLWDAATGTVSHLTGRAEQLQYVSWSPSLSHRTVALVRQRSLYILDLSTMQETLVASSSSDTFFYGIPSWSYEEEVLESNNALYWSPTGDHLAFGWFDASMVQPYSIPLYESSPYPASVDYNYPCPGFDNALAGVSVFDLAANATVAITMDADGLHPSTRYVYQVKWADNTQVAVRTVNRAQNVSTLLLADVRPGGPQVVADVIHTETSNAWVEVVDSLTFFNHSGRLHFVDLSIANGFRHVALYRVGQPATRVAWLTSGAWEVTSIVSVSTTERTMHYMSTQDGPTQRTLYRTTLLSAGARTRVSPLGWNAASFSPSGLFYWLSYLGPEVPSTTMVRVSTNDVVFQATDNVWLAASLQQYSLPTVRFTTFASADPAVALNAYMIIPPGVSLDAPTKKLPTLLYVYGGPGSQTVTSSFKAWGARNKWHLYLASRGFLVVSVDNRGTGARGEEFLHANYLRLGVKEVDDQLAVIEQLAEQPYVDEGHIGIWGWSFGGYMTCRTLTRGSANVKTGMAVAPVTDWRFYDSVYTERYMRTPQVNALGYNVSSVVKFAHGIPDNQLLLVHGTGDDNVHYLNSMELVKQLVAAQVLFDFMAYPNQQHGISNSGAQDHIWRILSRHVDSHLSTSPDQLAGSYRL